MLVIMRNTNNPSRQQGFVSLVVALTMIIILALLTVSFAQLARREQTQTLSRQLAIQANYAAETGINDARQEIMEGHISDTVNTPTDANTCVDLNHLLPPGHNRSPIINNTGDIRYACVLINLTPPTQNWSNVGPGSDRTLTFSTTDSPDRMVISWGSKDNHNTFPVDTSGKFPPNWPYPAVIQFSITPYSSPISRASLISNSYTAYLYPTSQTQVPGSGAYSLGIGDTAANGPILSGGCNPSGGPDHSTTYPCSVTITGLGAGGYTGPYLVHFLNLYDASNIILKYYHDPGNLTGTFKKGQIIVDSTGKAQDVLKRLRVQFQLPGIDGFVHSSGLELPDYAIEGQNVCKRLQTNPATAAGDPAKTDFIGLTGGTVNGIADDPCNVQ